LLPLHYQQQATRQCQCPITKATIIPTRALGLTLREIITALAIMVLALPIKILIITATKMGATITPTQMEAPTITVGMVTATINQLEASDLSTK